MLKELEKEGYAINQLDVAACDCGIYFLYNDSHLVYIGKSKAIRRRLMQHIDQNVKIFNKCFYILFPEEELDEREAEFIERYRPKYNMEGKRRKSWHKNKYRFIH